MLHIFGIVLMVCVSLIVIDLICAIIGSLLDL
nr:MAG TPA: hypothetical protein [Caudoviricetes sp.]DAS91500.1 MAG TPA: hypothetical protein [Caudoviricetes sp.]